MADTGKVISPIVQKQMISKDRIKLIITYGTPAALGVGGVFAGKFIAKEFATKFPTGKKWFMIGGLIAGLGLGYFVAPKINDAVNK